MPRDLEKLQGAWHLSGAEVDGRTVDDGMAQGAGIVISGDRFKAVGMGAPYEGTLTLDESTKPARLDMAIDVGHASGKKHPGIYRIAGDRFILCLNMAGATRPSKFESGPGLTLETFERSRDARATSSSPRSKKSKPYAAAAAAAGPETPISGEWQMVAGIFNGAPMSDDMVKWCKRVTQGNLTTVLAGPRTMMSARFTLDTSTKPVSIDYVILEGSGKGQSALGIVEWSGDTLSINMAEPGKPRPKDFHCKPGDKRTFTSWRLLQR